MNRWEVPEDLRRQMVEVARQFRRQPTATEGILWQVLRDRKLDGVKFRRQQNIGPFVVDFFAAEQRLIIEVDGPIHEFQQTADQQRQRLLESPGFRFVRIKAEVVEKNLGRALDVIRAALLPHPRPPLPQGERGSSE